MLTGVIESLESPALCGAFFLVGGLGLCFVRCAQACVSFAALRLVVLSLRSAV